METSTSDDGVVISLNSDTLELVLGVDERDTRLAAAVWASGLLPVTVPADYPLDGFVARVRGHVVWTPGANAAVTCALGTATHSVQWSGVPHVADRSDNDAVRRVVQAGRDGDLGESQLTVINADVAVDCFLGDATTLTRSTGSSIAPLPVAIGLVARRSRDDSVWLQVFETDIVAVGTCP